MWIVLSLSILVVIVLLLEELILVKPHYTIQDSRPSAKLLETIEFPLTLLGMTITFVTFSRFSSVVLAGAVNAAGFLMCLGGLALRHYCKRTLGMHFTIGVVAPAVHTLVQSGPYKYLRHPAYLGFIVYCVGFPLVMCSWLGLLVVSLPAVAISLALVVLEEKTLSDELGEVYHEYQKRTARLIPGVW
jgi:protein-S-isoprenylcysteine O-methyltransferase Ste14